MPVRSHLRFRSCLARSMEFSCAYALAPAFGSQTKGRMYQFASWYLADGSPAPIPPGFAGREQVARLLAEQQLYARLDLAPLALREVLRWARPNFLLPFDKAGIDPFTERFPVRFVLEGTVRGTGGLLLASEGCATTVPGLFAAGDVATRKLITGGRSGGGSHNGAWGDLVGHLGRPRCRPVRRGPAAVGSGPARGGLPAPRAAHAGGPGRDRPGRGRRQGGRRRGDPGGPERGHAA